MQLRNVAEWLRQSRYAVCLTGAGISTESGIPDFRGPQGVWTLNPKAQRMSDIRYYMSDPEVRKLSWQSRLSHPAWQAEPNAGHTALAQLQEKGLLQFLVTQNIDGLHQKAGFPQERLVEIHGTMREVVCMSCGERAPMERALERVQGGEEDPPCRTCGGILKSATISFGQNLVAADLERSQAEAARCDLFLAVGTSLGVYPAASLPLIALEAGARLVIVNAEATPFDEKASALFREPIGGLLTRLLALL